MQLQVGNMLRTCPHKFNLILPAGVDGSWLTAWARKSSVSEPELAGEERWFVRQTSCGNATRNSRRFGSEMKRWFDSLGAGAAWQGGLAVKSALHK